MPVAQLVAGQGGGQQHQRVALRVALAEEGHEGPVQCPQPASLDPAIEQLEQIFTARKRLQHGQALGIQRGWQQVAQRAGHTGSP
ncbi:hypothetical protein D3C75_1228400 [compost metagenome]